MEDDEPEEGPESLGFGVGHAPSVVSLAASFTPSSRRLSSHFAESTATRVRSARRLSWVNLEGRLVGAEEASSGRTITRGGGGWGQKKEEAVAWELFSPIHRVLVVAVVGVAVAGLNKSREIWRLRRSVELRDRVLLSMQQKLDDLCEQANMMKGWPETVDVVSLNKKEEFQTNKYDKNNKFSGCGCHVCDEHRGALPNGIEFVQQKASNGDETPKFKMPFIVGTEQEERRMSDLSDWASSVTSAADIQINSLSIEQDISNLQRECKEKDAIIKKLSAVVHASDVAGSKRIYELEDVVRRKNMIITKMKKDMAVLEQQVINLTRLRRPSTTTKTQRLPIMADNLLYDMDSSSATSSSSDSDSDSKNAAPVSIAHEDDVTISHKENNSAAKQNQRLISLKTPETFPKQLNRISKPRSVSPLTENTINQRPYSALRPKQLASTNGDAMANERHLRRGQQQTTPMKRWA